MIERGYIISLNYGERMKEKEFIKLVLKKYKHQQLVSAGIYVNNNPYNLQMLLYLNFSIDTSEFEKWMLANYPEKSKRFNYILGDILESISSKGYNIATFLDENTVDLTITKEANEIFLYPDREVLGSIWTSDILQNDLNVFLCHSSKDKDVIENIFYELQINGVKVWYDKYEIRPDDNIVAKINNGLNHCDLGIICISHNFLNFSTGWTKSELNDYMKKRMRLGKTNFICLNFDVNHEDLPPQVQEYRYIDLRDNTTISKLIETLKGKSKMYKNFA